eukprot:9471522-Pyramimonas_sp.AAC.1
MCRASPLEGPLNCYHVCADAGWRATLKSHESYLRECVDRNVPPCTLMKINTLQLEGFLPDAMHGMDEGFTSHVAGNIMFEIMEEAGWGPNQRTRASRLNDDLKQYYKASKETVRVDGKLTYERVRAAGDWPLLKAKAAATRHVVPYITQLASRFNSGSDHDVRRLIVCNCLNDAYNTMKKADRFLTQGQKDHLRHISVTMLGCYRNLSLEALESNTRKWKMVPKHHETQHILEYLACVINPMH